MKLQVSILFLYISILNVHAQISIQEISKNWQFRKVNATNWYPAKVPGTVHTDLLQNNLIPDPFYRDNETKLQWISSIDWEYQTYFNVSKNIFQNKTINLVFEGLDTYAEVFLNGKIILHANNMFRTWRIDVKKLIRNKDNHLSIKFLSADRIADSLANIATIKYPSENNRNFIRKAQYHFGWDFAPKLTTCGIWRNIKLESGENFITKKNITPSWNIELKQTPDSIGQSFSFTEKGKPIFIKGTNWVPADVFLPRISKEKYRNLLVAAKLAGINLLRVWGGGIYEADSFYDLCDSLHLMVWQDFMFAGAMYPADKASLENIKQEAIDNIKRLNHHPCIVLWCGNNEIDEAWNNWGWQKQFNLSNQDATTLWKEYQQIFQELLPQLVQTYSGKPYIPSTPLYGWGKSKSMTHGDSHYWGVWWGLEPIEKYKEKVPRFMSEYGMQSLPNLTSIKNFSLPNDRDTASVVMKLHQKHTTGYQNLAAYLLQNNLHPATFNEYIEATQVLQTKALATAITAHISAQPFCMGSILWQWNDCWPGVTWSVIDYYGNKKKVYYTIQKLFTAKQKGKSIIKK
jgi:beta-mannosidase